MKGEPVCYTKYKMNDDDSSILIGENYFFFLKGTLDCVEHSYSIIATQNSPAHRDVNVVMIIGNKIEKPLLCFPYLQRFDDKDFICPAFSLLWQQKQPYIKYTV